MGLEGELTSDVEQRLVPTALFATGTLGRLQRAGGEDRADQQNLSVSPRARDEQRRERQDEFGEAGGQIRHQVSLGQDDPNLTVMFDS